MSKRTMLGIDIGQNSVKLALVSKNKIIKTAVAELPDKLVQNGRLISVEALSEIINSTKKENGISCRHAAAVITGENVFVGNFTVPEMTHEQLMVNLPFEFRDFISEDLKSYTFDYAVVSVEANQDSESGGSMNIMAVAAPAAVIEQYTELMKKCGMKLDRLATCESALIGLYRAFKPDTDEEYCVLDVGQSSARLHIFKGSRFLVTRTIELGIASIEEALADELGIDIHLAHTYLLTNYNDCIRGEACTRAFDRLSLEIMRSLNFYRFSNPDNNLRRIYLCGGGAEIPSLVESIDRYVELPVSSVAELLPGNIEDPSLFLYASGITFD